MTPTELPIAVMPSPRPVTGAPALPLDCAGGQWLFVRLLAPLTARASHKSLAVQYARTTMRSLAMRTEPRDDDTDVTARTVVGASGGRPC